MALITCDASSFRSAMDTMIRRQASPEPGFYEDVIPEAAPIFRDSKIPSGVYIRYCPFCGYEYKNRLKEKICKTQN